MTRALVPHVIGEMEGAASLWFARLDRVAAEAHAGQTDLQGAPYINHLRRVAAAVPGDAAAEPGAAVAVALFHDALEDRALTERELARYVTATELAAVRLLTRPRGTVYLDYIRGLAGAPGAAGVLARVVKRADLADNLGRLTPRLEGLRARYERALPLLDEAYVATEAAARDDAERATAFARLASADLPAPPAERETP